MTLENAKVYLNLYPEADLDDVEDAIEEKAFELKQIFLNRFVPPKLVAARIKKLETLRAIGDSLLGWNLDEVEQLSYTWSTGMPEFMKEHQKELYSLKLKIANASNIAVLMSLLEGYKIIQLAYKDFWSNVDKKGIEVTVELQVEPEYHHFFSSGFNDEDVEREVQRVEKF